MVRRQRLIPVTRKLIKKGKLQPQRHVCDNKGIVNTLVSIYLVLSQLISFGLKLFIFKSLLLDPPHTNSASHDCQCLFCKQRGFVSSCFTIRDYIRPQNAQIVQNEPTSLLNYIQYCNNIRALKARTLCLIAYLPAPSFVDDWRSASGSGSSLGSIQLLWNKSDQHQLCHFFIVASDLRFIKIKTNQM